MSSRLLEKKHAMLLSLKTLLKSIEVHYLVIKVNKTHMTAKPNSEANVIHRAEMHKTGTIQWAFKRHIPLITNRSSGLTHACKSFLAFREPLDHTSHLLMIGSQTLPPYNHTSLFRQKGAPACKSPCHWLITKHSKRRIVDYSQNTRTSHVGFIVI